MSSARNCTPAELAQHFRTADPEESEILLESLILNVVAPLVRQTVKRRFSSARHTTPEDFEDVCADSVSAVIVRLRRYREGATEIADFESYTATVASNTADRFFAARAPQRARLRNRIRYVLTTDPRFAIRESEGGGWLCELTGQGMHSGPLTAKLHAVKPAAKKLPELIRELLAAAPGPLELTELTTLAAHTLGISDQAESVDDLAGFLPDGSIRFAHTAELRDWLRRLWAEVGDLPLLQRVALLLNLGSGAASKGDVTLCAVADLGIATFRTLAARLEMTEAELAAIWNDLPLGDNEIAARLRLERQQVINLRASARQRLTRRMAAIDNASPHTNWSRTNTGAQSDTGGIGG